MGHYEELGVSPIADAADIRRAYLGLARRHHPDRLVDAAALDRRDSADRMARINEAWTVLSDPTRRARYDGVSDQDRSQRITEPDATFVPFDPGDDPDPLDLDDTPYGPPTLSRRLMLMPAWLAIGAFGCIMIGGFIQVGPLLVLGLGLAVSAALSFLVLPLMALSRSARGDGL